MASWGDNIGNLFGVVFAIFVAVCLLSFFAAGWRPGKQSGGRKNMKGGDWTDYFHWTNWDKSNENSSQYTSAYSILIIFALLASLAFILPLVEKGVGGGGKA